MVSDTSLKRFLWPNEKTAEQVSLGAVCTDTWLQFAATATALSVLAEPQLRPIIHGVRLFMVSDN